MREFADIGHHAKEEGFLFKEMADGGFPAEDGPIGVMLRDHDEGRGSCRHPDERAQQSAAWSDSERQRICEASRGFADLMRSHIQKEDGILYPMARHHLTPEAFERVGDACARFGASRVGKRRTRTGCRRSARSSQPATPEAVTRALLRRACVLLARGHPGSKCKSNVNAPPATSGPLVFRLWSRCHHC